MGHGVHAQSGVLHHILTQNLKQSITEASSKEVMQNKVGNWVGSEELTH